MDFFDKKQVSKPFIFFLSVESLIVGRIAPQTTISLGVYHLFCTASTINANKLLTEYYPRHDEAVRTGTFCPGSVALIKGGTKAIDTVMCIRSSLPLPTRELLTTTRSKLLLN